MIICLSFSFSAFGKQQLNNKRISHSFKLKKLINKYYKKDLIKDLREFEKHSRPNRVPGSIGHKAAREYLQSKVNNSLCDKCLAHIDEFEFNMNLGISGLSKKSKIFNLKKTLHSNKKYFDNLKLNNIIWKKSGATEKTIVLTAHYDSLSLVNGEIGKDHRFQAANRNSTGVIIALEALRTAAKLELDKSFMIVFLDAGALGDQGHAQLNKYLKKNKIIVEGIIDLRMLGHDTVASDTTKKYDNMNVYQPGKEASESNWPLKQFESSRNKNRVKIEFRSIPNMGNFPFLELYKTAQIPAAVFTHNLEEDFDSRGFLSKSDFPEMLNQQTLYKAYKYLSFNLFFSLLSLQK
jgi:hypothetical protein